MNLAPIKRGSLFFAPMEGITDEAFRLTIEETFGDWDYYATDFLRLPAVGLYPQKYLIEHFGRQVLKQSELKKKTIFQILFSQKSLIEESVQCLEDLQIDWIDMNIGCPSNTVCKNGGGSFLLQDHSNLSQLIKKVRNNFSGRLSAKIRTGFDTTNNFGELIRLLNGEGIDMITVHARTREQLYKEPAEWKFIKQAVEVSQVPIIGNGDIWHKNDIIKMQNETGCFGVMVARGALMYPWMASSYKYDLIDDNEEKRIQLIKKFYSTYRDKMIETNISERGLLKQSKSVSRYLFSHLTQGEDIRRRLLLSQTSSEFYDHIFKIKNEVENTQLFPEQTSP